MYHKIAVPVIIVSLSAIIAFIVLTIFYNSTDTKELFDTQPLMTQIIELRTEVDILKGQMEVYQNVPIDLRSRIEVLETRYDNIIFFRDNINRCEDNTLDKER